MYSSSKVLFSGVNKIQFIPDMVGAVLEMTLIPEIGKFFVDG